MSYSKPSLFAILLLATAILLMATTSRSTIALTQPEPTIPHLNFTLQTTSPTITATTINSADLLSRLSQPGAPNLPYYSTLVALPPHSDMLISVTPKLGHLYTNLNITPAPTPKQPQTDDDALLFSITQPEKAYLPDPAIYQTNTRWPTTFFNQGSPSYQRDQRVARLDIFPFQYNPQTKTLYHYDQIDVTITFTQPPANTPTNITVKPTFDHTIINPQQASTWRHWPEAADNGLTPLPTDRDLYKIAVTEDGIYEITQESLVAAGMNALAVDPNTITMLHRGQTVAHQFIGDGDDIFDPGEKVRFYGWAFDSTRHEEAYVNHNIFWLWADDTAQHIPTIANPTGLPEITSFTETIITGTESVWFPTWTNKWDSFPNEPDAFFAGSLTKNGQVTVQDNYKIILPHPTSTGNPITYVGEINSQDSPIVDGTTRPHKIQLAWTNDPSHSTQAEWFGIKNVNITGQMPQSLLTHGPNYFTLIMLTQTSVTERAKIYLNELRVTYQRDLIADNNQLIFHDNGGDRTFLISEMSDNNPNNILAWNISSPHQPQAITIDNAHITGNNPYTYRIASQDPANSPARFILTHVNNIQTPTTIEQYIPTNIHPTTGADWVAIAHSSFMADTNRLALHRQQPNFGQFETLIVDIDDIINQMSYGFPIPEAINNYLTTALLTWATPPQFVTLVGDSTINPRQLDLPNLGNADEMLIPTNISFIDRFQGQIPEDTSFTLLIGDDHYPDIALGRFPVQTVNELNNVIDKIIEYETKQLTPASWQESMLFISDDTDAGGNFCLENSNTIEKIPTHYNTIERCLPDDPTGDDIIALRDDIYADINFDGVSIANYRGHGGVTTWGASDGQVILEADLWTFWNNSGKPVVLLSADCLDGYFALPERSGLGETFFTIGSRTPPGSTGTRGTVAHWSSSGLGFSNEHTVLHEGFYIALFDKGYTQLGTAIHRAKEIYVASGLDISEFYAFTLLGDPAMQLMRPNVSIDKTVAQPNATIGDTLDYTLTINNNGIYAPLTTITDTLPSGLDFINATSNTTITVNQQNQDIIIQVNDHIPWQESITINLTAQVNNAAPSGQPVINYVEVTPLGRNINTAPQTDTASVLIDAIYWFTYNPAVFTP
ncbi:MAG TPA: C25 family cysteine peptidase [Anaerolineae bacterium]|nr:C25 family cysteine peptidase [Anaerolineae bacterium]